MPKAAIVGLAGPSLQPSEAELFRASDPLGFILFKRNCETPAGLKALCAALRACVGRDDAPILIDQEGGPVARLRSPNWWTPPAAASVAALGPAAVEAARLVGHRIGIDLRAAGITVDCAPVADLRLPGAHEIIGVRAYGTTPDAVAPLARAMAEGLAEAGVLPVLKHLPGHGRALVDSHEALPRVETPRAELERTDLAAFRALRDLPLGMTAHVVYTALDPDRPATLSPTVISQLVREVIGFDGLLMTDDLSMKALGGPFADRVSASLEAGCDVVLHCNGDPDEMRAVLDATPAMGRRADRRWSTAEAGRIAGEGAGSEDPAALEARLAALGLPPTS